MITGNHPHHGPVPRTPLRARLPAVVIAFALVCVACGLQDEEQAQIIEEVQYELLGTSTSTTSTTIAERPTFIVSFFWHTAGDNRLRVLTRPRDERPSAAETLTELVAGPLPEDFETSPDLQTALSPTMEPRLSQVDGGNYQIQIEWPAEEQLTTEQAAEFVCTATQFAEIDAVTIVNADGVPFTLSGAGAIPIAGPARSTDFGDCEEDPIPGELEPVDGEAPLEGDAVTTTTP